MGKETLRGHLFGIVKRVPKPFWPRWGVEAGAAALLLTEIEIERRKIAELAGEYRIVAHETLFKRLEEVWESLDDVLEKNGTKQFQVIDPEHGRTFRIFGLNEKLLAVLFEDNPESRLNVAVNKEIHSVSVENSNTGSGIHLCVSPSRVELGQVFTDLSIRPKEGIKGITSVQEEALNYIDSLKKDKARVWRDLNNSVAVLTAIVRLPRTV